MIIFINFNHFEFNAWLDCSGTQFLYKILLISSRHWKLSAGLEKHVLIPWSSYETWRWSYHDARVKISSEISAVQNLFINKQTCSVLNQYWISDVHYLKIFEQSCFSPVQLWNPFFSERKKNQRWTALKTSFLKQIFGNATLTPENKGE